MKSSKPLPPKTPLPLRNHVFQGDCGDVLQQFPAEFVDLVYLDPPFLTQKSHRQTTRDRTKTFSFNDLWQSHEEYARFLLERASLCRNVLKPTGSLYFHCDRNAVHIARLVLDEIFGPENFRSEIIWTYRRWSNSRNGLLPSHQNILYYTKSDEFVFHPQFSDYSPSTNVDQILQQRARDEHGKSVYRRDHSGAVLSNGPKRGVPLGDVWDIPYLNPKAKERVGYPTQKPILLLERMIELSTNPGELVLDPFCGSGSSLVAAKLLGREFLGIDLSEAACQLTKSRLETPVKSSSALLEAGRESYRNADQEVLQLLNGCDFVPVQRNQGIDAIVNLEDSVSIGLVRIQRASETLLEAANSLCKASRGKNAALLIVVKTHEDALLFGADDVPEHVFVIDSPACAISSALRTTGSGK